MIEFEEQPITAATEEVKAEETKKTKKAKIVKPISTKQLEKYNASQAQKGVIYISRVPPGMTPTKIRNVMSSFGEIGRIFIQPEDRDTRRERKQKYGKSGRKRYIGGWVEFNDCNIAKSVVESLNGTPIGGHVRCEYSQDLWLLRFLPGFQWNDLNDKKSQEKEMRIQRLQMAIARAKKLNETTLARAQQSKIGKLALEKRIKKRAKKQTK